jgi:prolyl 4-hydroxylase
MTALVRFAPALGHWISSQLDAGVAAPALHEVMCERSMSPEVALAIVDAFVRARVAGVSPPVDAVEMNEPPRLRAGTSVRTSERVVRVAARVDRPVLAVLNDVLDAHECEELIALARPRLRPSTIVDPESGIDIVTGLRQSFGMFFRPGENALVRRLDQRLAEVMNMPLENGEGLQVLHYPQGAGSAPHHDYLVPSNPTNRASIARSGQRVSTLVAYLNDVPAGGQTVFPALGWAVSPQRGNAVYFEYCDSAGALDAASLHASSAVEQGEKWVATKWMRAQRFVSAG